MALKKLEPASPLAGRDGVKEAKIAARMSKPRLYSRVMRHRRLSRCAGDQELLSGLWSQIQARTYISNPCQRRIQHLVRLWPHGMPPRSTGYLLQSSLIHQPDHKQLEVAEAIEEWTGKREKALSQIIEDSLNNTLPAYRPEIGNQAHLELIAEELIAEKMSIIRLKARKEFISGAHGGPLLRECAYQGGRVAP